MRDLLSLDDLLLPAQVAPAGTISGVIKERPEDFRVDELSASEPSGTGDQLLVRLEKRAMTTDDLVAHVATVLGIDRRDIGVAGLKDKQAVTTQWFSLPISAEDTIEAIETDLVRVLESARHDTKLKRGASGGNRFDILIRGTPSSELGRAQAIADHINDEGLPNAYGAQRFGHDGSTFEMGLDILAGNEASALARVGRHRHRFMKRLALNAVQSGLFNLWLRQRVDDGLLGQILTGDVLEDLKLRVPIIAMDLPRETLRYEQGVVMLTGPMFGIKMRGGSGPAGRREKAVLERAKLGLDAFASFRKVMPGARRAARVRPEDLEISPDSAGLRLSFVMPPGAYATEVIRTFVGDPRGDAEEWSP